MLEVNWRLEVQLAKSLESQVGEFGFMRQRITNYVDSVEKSTLAASSNRWDPASANFLLCHPADLSCVSCRQKSRNQCKTVSQQDSPK